MTTTKRSLLALSHAMERSLEVGRDEGRDVGAPLVIGLFQRRHFFEIEADRYARLAEQGATCIVGFVGDAVALPDGVHAFPLTEDDPLSREWSLVVLDGSLGTSLVAHDLDDVAAQADSLESGRLFDARWSFSPHDATVEAQRLLGHAAPHLSAEALALAQAAIERGRATDLSLTEERLAAVTEVLVRSIDEAYHRADRMATVARIEQDRAEHDPMTGLGNRRFLERYLSRWQRESPAHLAALLVDLDGLKTINDTFGHAAGDLAILALAQVLRECTRPQDVAVRLGGDEFLILLPGVGEDAALSVGNRIVEQVATVRLPDPWSQVALGASVGILGASTHELDLAGLDEALYEAKRQGKGTARTRRRALA